MLEAGDGERRDDRCRDACRRLPDGAVRAHGPHRASTSPWPPRRASGSGWASPRPAAPVADPGAARGRGASRALDRARLLRYPAGARDAVAPEVRHRRWTGRRRRHRRRGSWRPSTTRRIAPSPRMSPPRRHRPRHAPRRRASDRSIRAAPRRTASHDTIAHDARRRTDPVREAWIVEAVRTPIGRYGGALAASARTTSPRSSCAPSSSAPASTRRSSRT